MSATFVWRYRIDPNLDLSRYENDTDSLRFCTEIWARGLGYTLTEARNRRRDGEIAMGVTEYPQFKMVLNIPERTWSLYRQYTTLEAAEERKAWVESNIPKKQPGLEIYSMEVSDNDVLEGENYPIIR